MPSTLDSTVVLAVSSITGICDVLMSERICWHGGVELLAQVIPSGFLLQPFQWESDHAERGTDLMDEMSLRSRL